MDYLVLKWLHVLSSTLLFGTGIGSAYYMLLTSLAREPVAVARVVRQVVWADWMFTTTTIVLQPLTGLNVPLNSSRQRTGNLTKKNFGSVLHFNHYGGALVFRAGLRVPGHQVFTGVVPEVTDRAAHRHAVYVHIYR